MKLISPRLHVYQAAFLLVSQNSFPGQREEKKWEDFISNTAHTETNEKFPQVN